MRIVLLGHPGSGKSQLLVAGLSEFKSANIGGWWWSFPTEDQLRITEHSSALQQHGYRPTRETQTWTLRIKRPKSRTESGSSANQPPAQIELVDFPGGDLRDGTGNSRSLWFSQAMAQADGIIVTIPCEPGDYPWWYDRWLIHHIQSRVNPQRHLKVDLAVLAFHQPPTEAQLAWRLGPWRHYLEGLAANPATWCDTVALDLSRGHSPAMAIPLFRQLQRAGPFQPKAARRLDLALNTAQAAHPAQLNWSPELPNGRAPTRIAASEPQQAPLKTGEVRVVTLGPPGSGRTSLLCALHRELGPETHNLWINPTEQDDMVGLVQGWTALASGHTLPFNVGVRRRWRFQVVNGATTWMNVDWQEVSAPGELDAASVSRKTDPVVRSHLILATIPAETLLSPVTPGTAGSVRAATGMIQIDAAITRSIIAATSAHQHPPLIVLAVTKTDLLARPTDPDHAYRTRPGVVDDLRLLLPAAFSTDAATAIFFPAITSSADATSSDQDLQPRGVAELAHLLLIADLVQRHRQWILRGERRDASRTPFIRWFAGRVQDLVTGVNAEKIGNELHTARTLLNSVAADMANIELFRDGSACSADEFHEALLEKVT